MVSVAKPESGRSRSNMEKTLDRGFIGLTFTFALSIAAILIIIIFTVGQGAISALQEFGLGFLFQSAWNPVEDEYGIWPMIYGTMMSSAIALSIAVPLGLGTAIFLSEDFIPVKIRTVLVFLVELLAAIPSVVYGLWGIFVLIPILKPMGDFLHDNFGWFPLFSTPLAGPGMLPAGLVLSIMILPIITAIARDSRWAIMARRPAFDWALARTNRCHPCKLPSQIFASCKNALRV